MKLLLDQNLSYRLLEPLSKAYPGSAQVGQLKMGDAADLAIWEYARKQGYSIVTRDADFHEYSLLKDGPPYLAQKRESTQPNHLAEAARQPGADRGKPCRSLDMVCGDLLSISGLCGFTSQQTCNFKNPKIAPQNLREFSSSASRSCVALPPASDLHGWRKCNKVVGTTWAMQSFAGD
jgi:predicted nuclease of predicted toxin-antitoxin system